MTDYDKVGKGGITEIDLDDEEFQHEFLRGVDKLEAEAGDWKLHLPYDAIMMFYEDIAIHEHFAEHVTNCRYCRELLDTLRPTR